MTLSADMITRYRSEVDIDWRHALVMFHPSAGYRYLIDYEQEFQGVFDGGLRDFQPVPMQFLLPGVSDSGVGSLGITLGNIGLEATTFLDQAITDPTRPITCWHSIFIEGNSTPQIDPWTEYTMTNITVGIEVVSAQAARSDIMNRKFPRIIYKVEAWPGLKRR